MVHCLMNVRTVQCFYVDVEMSNRLPEVKSMAFWLNPAFLIPGGVTGFNANSR